MCSDANDYEDTQQWDEDILQPLLAKYEPKNIFSADDVTAGRQSKDQPTVLVCANIDGS